MAPFEWVRYPWGYKDVVMTNIAIDAGKELMLTIGLEESVTQLGEVTVRPNVGKNKPLNEMVTVSAHTFSIEETQKFAAAVNDPARMATAYAGVVGADDGGNVLVIRGNTPTGLLWRMEGMEIPNPNHFANLGTAGGGISILSAQLLSDSDFMTGAFPAEYGNALSGVFDLRRAGLIGAELRYDLLRKEYQPDLNQLQTTIQTNDYTHSLQAFAQGNLRLSEQLTFNAGLHYLRLLLNGTDAIEPRGSLRWAFAPPPMPCRTGL
ncbi:MAG: TonB-dependent receptor [Cytophagaceae bacterium]|nr:TonB-dependent receptor [Cytophagaceae bacterium]